MGKNSRKANAIESRLRETMATIEHMKHELASSRKKIKSQKIVIEHYEGVAHEVRNLNKQLKYHCHIGQRFVEGSIEAKTMGSVAALSQLLFSRLNLLRYDLGFNEEFELVSLYKKFDKALRCIRPEAQAAGIKMKLEGESRSSTYALSFIGMVPVMLLQNAVKYSPVRGNDILINFIQQSDDCIITIENFGPSIEVEEYETIFKNGVRGKHVCSNISGSGIGLYYVKRICDLHKIRVEVSCTKSGQNFSGMPLGNVKVTLTVPTVEGPSWGAYARANAR